MKYLRNVQPVVIGIDQEDGLHAALADQLQEHAADRPRTKNGRAADGAEIYFFQRMQAGGQGF